MGEVRAICNISKRQFYHIYQVILIQGIGVICHWLPKVDMRKLGTGAAFWLLSVSLPSSPWRVSHGRKQELGRVKGSDSSKHHTHDHKPLFLGVLLIRRSLNPIWCCDGLGGLVSLLSPEPWSGLEVDDSVTLRMVLKEQQQAEPEEAYSTGTKDDTARTLMDHQPGPGMLTDASGDTNTYRWQLRTRWAPPSSSLALFKSPTNMMEPEGKGEIQIGWNKVLISPNRLTQKIKI